MKKYIFTLFALLMAVMTASAQASTTYFVELTADSRPTGASFTLTYQLGSAAAVDVSEFLNGDEHAAPVPGGAKVTLTVTPAQGYVAGTVTGETFMDGSEMRVRTRGNDPEINILGEVEITQSATNPNVFTYTQPTANVRLNVSYLKKVTVTADDKTKQVGDADPTLTATVKGTIGDDQVSYSLSRAQGEEVGEYAITPTGNAVQGKYAVTFVAGKLTITKADEPDNPDNPDNHEPVVEEVHTDDGGMLITTTTTENLEDGTEKVTKVEEKKDAEGNLEGTTKTTIVSAAPEVSGEPVSVKDEATGKEESYLPASKQTQQKISKITDIPIAFENGTEKYFRVVEETIERITKDGKKDESTSVKLVGKLAYKDCKVALRDMKKGKSLKANMTKGQLKGLKKTLKKIIKSMNHSSTRGEGDADDDMIELESGEEYEILQDGDLVLTLVTSESDVEISSITVSEPADEPDEPTPAESESITISKAKQVPYYSEYNLDFTDKPDLKAYVATGYDKAKGTIWLTRVKQVPAETGFLLMGDPGDYDIPVSATAENCYYKNMFRGTLTGTTIQTTEGKYTNYYLSNGKSGVGFYKVTNTEGQKIGANRCYLPILTDIPANGAEGDAEVIKVSAAKQVPYYTSKNVDFTSLDAQGVKAYTATGYNYTSGVIWLTRVKKVPAQTGILVMADKAGEYSVPTTSVQSVYENMFTGSETAQTIYTTETVGDIEYINYYLSNGTSGVGFYKVTNEDGVKMSANRSYLQIPKREKAAGARGMDGHASFSKMVISDNDDDVIAIPVYGGMGGDDEGTTGIISTQFQNADQEIYYNLQGQRIDRPRKGLYIKNGRVVVIK